MRSLAILALVVACSHSSSSTTPHGSWHGSETLANVPADTPYLFAWLEAPPEAVRKRLMANFDALVVPKINDAAAVPLDQRLAMPAYQRALYGILDAMHGTDPKLYWENLGFKHNGQWVLYGLGIWPVLRVEVASADKLRAILADAVKTLNMPIVEQKELGGVPYWIASRDGFSGIVSVTDHDAVVAMVPTTSLADALPMVLGTKPVAHSLRDSGEIAKIIETHHFTQHLITFLDMHHVVAALERQDAFSTKSIFTAPACHADYERIAAAVPRMVFGYERLDEAGFKGSFELETSPDAAKQLASLHTAMPTPPDLAHALVSFVVAADVDAGIEVARSWMQALVDHPFECQQLAFVKPVLQMGISQLKAAIPQEMHGLHGGELVIDDAHESPPSGSGYALISGDQIAMTVTKQLSQLPIGIQVAPDGQPAELPVGILQMAWLQKAFMAMHTGRVAVAIGEQSKTEVTAALAAPNARHSPLAALSWDIAKFLKQMPTLLKDDNKSNLDQFSTIQMAFDVRENALVFDVAASWLK